MKLAVITGAGGGLGRVFATALAADGWTIVALGRTEETLTRTIDACAGDHHAVFVCDITLKSDVSTTFAAILNRFGRIDLLINNAGIPGPVGTIDEIDVDEFDATVNVNLRGTFLCSQAAFAAMSKAGGGRIINNGSIAAHAPRAGAAAYAASKAAVASLTTSLNLDGRGHNIVATQLDIGNARTELLGTFCSDEPTFDAVEAGRIITAVAALPLDVTANQITISASEMPYVGRG